MAEEGQEWWHLGCAERQPQQVQVQDSEHHCRQVCFVTGPDGSFLTGVVLYMLVSILHCRTLLQDSLIVAHHAWFEL